MSCRQVSKGSDEIMLFLGVCDDNTPHCLSVTLLRSKFNAFKVTNCFRILGFLEAFGLIVLFTGIPLVMTYSFSILLNSNDYHAVMSCTGNDEFKTITLFSLCG